MKGINVLKGTNTTLSEMITSKGIKMREIDIDKVIRANIYQAVYKFTGDKNIANKEANRRMAIINKNK